MSKLFLDEEAAASHFRWREEIKKAIPDLEARVFALRYGGWAGCGFHYDMVERLEQVIRIANDGEGPIPPYKLSTDKVIYKSLVESVQKAEWSKANNGKSPTDQGAPWHQTDQEKLEKAMKLFELVADGLKATVDEKMILLKKQAEELTESQWKDLHNAAYPEFLKQTESLALGLGAKKGSTCFETIDSAYQQISVQEFPHKEIAMIVMAYGIDEAIVKFEEALPLSAPRM